MTASEHPERVHLPENEDTETGEDTEIREAPILVVDDEAAILEFVSRILDSRGYEAVTVANAQEALDKLQSRPFPVMIVDIRMPGMSGLDLLETVKEDYPDTMVVMITGMKDTQTAIQAMKQGAFDYLLKPFNPEEILIAVQRALEHRVLVMENKEYQRDLEKKVEKRTRQLRKQHSELKRLHEQLVQSFYNSVRVSIGLIELHEPFLAQHAKRVAALSIQLCRFIGLPDEEVRTAEMAGLLHDIGVIGLPQDWLTTYRTKLSTKQFERIKKAPIISQHVLKPIAGLEDVGKIIRAHHEHYDGSGFPDGLRKAEIPYQSRILAITNAYDAMRFKRPPRQGLSLDDAIDHFQEQAGKQFDPKLVSAFLYALGFKEGEWEGDSSDYLEGHEQYQYREFMLENDEEKTMAVGLADLEPGMKLASNVHTSTGRLMLRQGTVLTASVLGKLRRMEALLSTDAIRIYPGKGESAPSST